MPCNLIFGSASAYRRLSTGVDELPLISRGLLTHRGHEVVSERCTRGNAQLRNTSHPQTAKGSVLPSRICLKIRLDTTVHKQTVTERGNVDDNTSYAEGWVKPGYLQPKGASEGSYVRSEKKADNGRAMCAPKLQWCEVCGLK